ncbi:MAG TPA: diacylglycerol kinase family protein [Candidatus Paceibacterota bacterium]|nr:diacylglycerol kinase family protein [Candidatus Paceibacterota bacterium]
MNKLIKSFGYALQGIWEAFSERNFTIQVLVGALAITVSFFVDISDVERLIIVLCAALVLGSEAMNSATERLLNFVSPGHNEDIRIIKDLMAASVFMFSSAAFVVGIWIFGHALHFF